MAHYLQYLFYLFFCNSGRVVTLSSSIHRLARTFNFDDIMTTKNYEMFANYGQSKLANILFTRELHKRFVSSLYCKHVLLMPECDYASYCSFPSH